MITVSSGNRMRCIWSQKQNVYLLCHGPPYHHAHAVGGRASRKRHCVGVVAIDMSETLRGALTPNIDLWTIDDMNSGAHEISVQRYEQNMKSTITPSRHTGRILTAASCQYHADSGMYLAMAKEIGAIRNRTQRHYFLLILILITLDSRRRRRGHLLQCTTQDVVVMWHISMDYAILSCAVWLLCMSLLLQRVGGQVGAQIDEDRTITCHEISFKDRATSTCTMRMIVSLLRRWTTDMSIIARFLQKILQSQRRHLLTPFPLSFGTRCS